MGAWGPRRARGGVDPAVAMLVLVAALAGCGDDRPTGTDTTPPGTTAPPTTGAPTTLAPTTDPPVTVPSTTVAPTTVPATTAPPATAPVAVPSPTSLDPGPLVGRFQPATVAVGDELLVFGGVDASSSGSDDGAAYDTKAGTWRSLPSSGGRAEGATVALAVGDSTAVFAGAGGVAALDVAVGSWRAMDPVPFPAGRFFAAGDDLYVAEDAFPLEQVGMARLDPSSGAWTPLPPVAGSFLVDLHSVDGTLIAITDPATDATDRAAAALEPDGWRDLAMPALEWIFGSVSTVAGGRLLVWAGDAVAAPDALNDHGLAYDAATGEWSEIERLPGDWWECYASAADWDGLLLLDVCGITALYDPVAGSVLASGGLEGEQLSPARWWAVGGDLYRWGERYCYGDCETPPILVFQRWG